MLSCPFHRDPRFLRFPSGGHEIYPQEKDKPPRTIFRIGKLAWQTTRKTGRFGTLVVPGRFRGEREQGLLLPTRTLGSLAPSRRRTGTWWPGPRSPREEAVVGGESQSLRSRIGPRFDFTPSNILEWKLKSYNHTPAEAKTRS